MIHNANNRKSNVGVLLEVKKTTNRSEMNTVNQVNTKAMQELVLCYLRERIASKNLEVRHLVVINIYEWFIIDAGVFERLFAQDKTLLQQFEDFSTGRLSGTTTDFFYREIARPAIQKVKDELIFTHFDIRKTAQ